MNDLQVMHAMQLDDAYRVEKTLASGSGGITELVTIGNAGPFVRKKIPSSFARRRIWSTVPECECWRLPSVEATYELPDYFVVIYDFVPGDSLEHLIEKEGPFSLEAGLKMAVELCEAASALHQRDIVHRDIAPGNIVVSADGVHLIDLGIARFRIEGASKDTASLGTWGFASPEQYGFAQTDARSDVYSIGRVLGYGLTGLLPGSDEYDRAFAGDALEPSVRALIEKACAFEPSARFQTSDDFAKALRDMPEKLNAQSGCGAERSASDASTAASHGSIGESEQGKAAGDAARAKPRAGRAVRKVVGGMLALAAIALLAAGISIAVRGLEPTDFGTRMSASGGAQESSSGSVAGDAVQRDLQAASDSGSSAAASQLANPTAGLKPFRVENVGWYAVSGGYVNYAFDLVNDNDCLIQFPEVDICGYAEDGSMVFSDSRVFALVPAHETYAMVDMAGNGTVPARIEIVPHDPQPGDAVANGKAPLFEVESADIVNGAYGDVNCVGTVTMLDAGSDGGSSGLVSVSIIFKAADGSAMGGFAVSVDRPKQGAEASFSIPLYDVPDYASYEVVAHA